MRGFFSKAGGLATKRPLPLLPQCGSCGLYKHCLSPKMPISGKGKRKILIVGEAPGRNEDEQNRPFVGESGQLLEEALQKANIDFRRDCWITNACICRPERNILPPKAVEYCRPNLVKAIKDLQPEIIIPLGASAVESLIGWVWKDDVKNIGRWIGWHIPSQKLNAWICPAWHPSYVLRTGYGESGKDNDVRRLIFEKHLQRACKLSGRPWEELPQWEQSVKTIFDDKEAARQIAAFVDSPLIAYDYETNMLKPDSSQAEIVACSISNGTNTIAYPWLGNAIIATKKLLGGPNNKVASNLKFEHRWSMRFGMEVRNWKWDTMLAAHALDNRPGITSIKFQAFALLGVDSWDDAIKPYLKSKGGNLPNRIKEAPLPAVLKYCGLDSLYEWHVAVKQMERFGVKP